MVRLQRNSIGAVRRRTGIRRLSVLLLIIAALTIALSACGGSAATPTATTTAPTPAATTPPTAAPASPTAVIPSPEGATRTPGMAPPATAVSPTPALRATAPPQSTAFPMRGPHIGYGMNAWLPGTDMDRTLGLLTGAGFGWARQWISWESVEPSPGNYNWRDLDAVTAAAERHNVKLLIVFLRSPEWAGVKGGIPPDKSLFAGFLATVAGRYKGKIAAYEVWNEQNLAIETGGQIDVAEYVELLKAAFPAIKGADPGAFVLYGGLTPTGVNDPAVAIEDVVYLQQSYAYNGGEIKRYFDVLGAHPGGMHNPPDTFWPENPGPGPGFFEHRSFYFRRIEDLRKVMEAAGDGNKQIWLTEFGWTTKNQVRGYEYGQYNSEQDQAEYLVRAYRLAGERWPWVGVMFMWNLNFSTIVGPEDEKAPWSIINADYSPRPAYEALKRMPKR
ncbi:MAG: hypothetical protein M3Q65_18520 [Chloroflexota bacterium]|nr:hypothetical protein [Chloroflexota bacterium]